MTRSIIYNELIFSIPIYELDKSKNLPKGAK